MPFGLTISTNSAQQIARDAVNNIPTHDVCLVVTPNIDHIAMIRRSLPLARAYCNATLVVCDGWPVQAYFKWCGLKVARVTGCELISELMSLAPFKEQHRLFFVVDSVETQQAVDDWASRYGAVASVAIPPIGFEQDVDYSIWLAGRIVEHQTTLLIMAVGAPRSEIFVDNYHSFLPPCWAFCVGQAVKIKLGLVRRAPSWLQSLRLEWLWRVIQEPSRLTMRYLTSMIGFGLAVFQDQLNRQKGNSQ
jgi:N-acetylglucosaminyldiphosphoundecaprenol N-acetyl-beta-D-mannosaminyltransferase